MVRETPRPHAHTGSYEPQCMRCSFSNGIVSHTKSGDNIILYN